MNKLFFIFLFLSLFSVSGCRRSLDAVADKCKDVVCQNGGTCDGGKCVCVNGYGGNNCATLLQGMVVGNVSPPNIVNATVVDLVLTSTNTADSYQTYIGLGGGFIFDKVQPGNYILHVHTNSSYWVAPDMNVTVTGGDTTSAGIILISYNAAAQTGTVTFSIDGGPNHILNYDDFHGGGSDFGSIYISGSEPDYPKYFFSLSIGGVTGPGIYTVTNGSSLEVRHYVSSGNEDGHWRTVDFSSAVTANVTSYDTVTKKFSGTFSGTLSPVSPTVGSIQISGSFINVYGGS